VPSDGTKLDEVAGTSLIDRRGGGLPVEPALARAFMCLLASDEAEMQDPFPLYDRLREHASVIPLGPAVLVTRHELVSTVGGDRDRFSSMKQARGTTRVEAARAVLASDRLRALFDDVRTTESMWLTQSDGDDHWRRRQLMHRAFSPRRIGALGELAARYTNVLLDELKESDRCDLGYLAYRLPLLMICDLLGVPHSDADRLYDWGERITRNLYGGQGEKALVDAHEAHQEFREYVRRLVRAEPSRSELLSLLARGRAEGLATDDQVTAMFVELHFGGYETTRNLVANGLRELLTRPREWRALTRDPGLASNAVEELLRFVTPVQWNSRVVIDDTVLDGTPLSRGQSVLLLLAAANRDPRVFTDPASLDVRRPNAGKQVAFGFARHHCLGQALARLEATTVVRTLATRFPDTELESDTHRFVGNAFLRRVEELPATLGPERAGAWRADREPL
jgi:cytochrome P450